MPLGGLNLNKKSFTLSHVNEIKRRDESKSPACSSATLKLGQSTLPMTSILPHNFKSGCVASGAGLSINDDSDYFNSYLPPRGRVNNFHYVKNFNQSTLAQCLKHSVGSIEHVKNNAVFKWLQDLRMLSENECLCILQAKSLTNKISSPVEPNSMYIGQKTAKSDTEKRVRDKDQSSQQENRVAEPQTVESSSDGLYEANQQKTNLYYLDPLFQQDNEMFEMIESILIKKDLVYNQIEKLFKKLERNNWRHIPGLIRTLVENIESTIDLITRTNLTAKVLTVKSQISLSNLVDQIRESASQIDKLLLNFQLINQTIMDLSDYQKLDKNKIFIMIKNLLQMYTSYFNTVIKLFTKYTLSKLSQISKKTSSAKQVSKASCLLSQLFDASLKSECIKKALIQENFIILLFDLVKNPHYRKILDLILRLLSIVINDFDALATLQQVDSISILTDIVCDEQLQEWTRTECAGCVAQISSPYLDFWPKLKNTNENLSDLIRALTILCRDSSDVEIFLIGIAALANLSFLDQPACEYLNQFSTMQVLIENFYLKSFNSIFVKDQMATILANMALFENSRNDIVELNGLNLLCELLNERPSDYNQNESKSIDSELSACERVQQKSAIAISRFSKDPKHALSLAELNVVSRLSTLCQSHSERNQSDSVLMACVAALKQIMESCESVNFNIALEVDVQSLLKFNSSSLLEATLIGKDSFLVYSSNEESYV